MEAVHWLESTGEPKIRLPLRKARLIVGRAPECDIVLSHATVSRRHAQIRIEQGQVLVRDLDSRNGTFLDDAPVKRTFLSPNQIIRFGDVALRLVSISLVKQDPGSDEETESILPRTRLSEPAGECLERLTQAQTRVLDCLKEGLAEQDIAERLEISRHTVHNHVRKIYAAYGVHSRAELLAAVFRAEK